MTKKTNLQKRLRVRMQRPIRSQNKTSRTQTKAARNLRKGLTRSPALRKAPPMLMASMEGKTVSMKVYVGTIVGVIVLMLLARCGGS